VTPFQQNRNEWLTIVLYLKKAHTSRLVTHKILELEPERPHQHQIVLRLSGDHKRGRGRSRGK